MAKRARESDSSEPEAGIVKVVDPSPLGDTPVAVDTKPEASPSTGPSFSERIRGFCRFLLRLVSLLIILAIIGVALFYVLPWLYQQFITPTQQNTAQIRELQTWQEQTKQQLVDLQTKLETNETIQNQHDQSLIKLDRRVSDIERDITARTQSLAALEQMQSELQSQNKAASAELERQVNLLKAMELLSRARLFMYESNFGLARQDVQLARDLLGTIQPNAPADASLTDDLDEIIRRLDLTLSNLPDLPVAASDDLDIAWQILLSGLPQVTPTVDVIFTPVVTLSSTPTAIATFTPTPRMTVNPSATP